jgi:N-methylhydantoinase A/oxoprolinase/acetone carboxylase beta subunit
VSSRVGIDVGGTFTDTVVVDEATGDIRVLKHRTTYERLSNGVMASLDEVGATDRDVSSIFHGTTLVSNAIVQRRGAPTGVLTTRGFRDLLDIRRNRRQHLYAIYWDKPPTLVRRMLRREVGERLDRDGAVVEPLDEESVREAVRFLRHKGVESYAVCTLFSFKNDAHERRIREIVEEEHPGADVSLSSVVSPEIREYERMSTVTLNALVRPVIRDYLTELEGEIDALGLRSPLYLMKANGGVASPETIKAKAIELYESGPAAGVTAAVALGEQLGIPNLITFDMGGTTTDVGLVVDGRPITTLDSEIEWSIPVRIPMTLIRSVGAGGGSIAYVDKGGALKVGPESAGSMPGPAAYGWGGERPTVTDANLVLGRLPAGLLGGAMTLDADAARAVVDRDVAGPFGWTTERAAEAISQIARMNMVQLVRELTVGQGYDPRDFTLLAFGGNGGQYAAEVAQELGMRDVIVPVSAAVFSALGCLHADIRHEYVQTVFASVEPITAELLATIAAVFRALEARGREDLARDGVTETPVFVHEYDVRYVGEAYEIRVEQPGTEATEAALEEVVERFHAEHERLYGFRREDPVEVLNARLTALVALPKPSWAEVAPADAVQEVGRRRLTLDGEAIEVPVHRREEMGAGPVVDGPALVEESQSTTFVPRGWSARIDPYGNLRLAR